MKYQYYNAISSTSLFNICREWHNSMLSSSWLFVLDNFFNIGRGNSQNISLCSFSYADIANRLIVNLTSHLILSYFQPPSLLLSVPVISKFWIQLNNLSYMFTSMHHFMIFRYWSETNHLEFPRDHSVECITCNMLDTIPLKAHICFYFVYKQLWIDFFIFDVDTKTELSIFYTWKMFCHRFLVRHWSN